MYLSCLLSLRQSALSLCAVSMAFSVAIVMSLSVSAHASSLIWQDLSKQDLSRKSTEGHLKSTVLATQPKVIASARQMNVNLNKLKEKLSLAPLKHFKNSTSYIELPLPSGEFRQFTLLNAPIMDKALSDANPDIHTYRVIDTLNPANSGRLDITSAGFHGVFTFNGDTVFIDPIGNKGQYQSYFRSEYIAQLDKNNHTPLSCKVNNSESSHQYHHKTSSDSTQTAQKQLSFGTELRTYRIAVGATGEFSQFHGGTKASALSAIVTGINRVNQVFERDLAITLELVANNSDVIFLNPDTDPFTDDDADSLIDEIGTELNNTIGFNQYDIGHVFSTGGGGLAGLGVVCGNSKAQGVTGSYAPINDPFFIDFVAHEIGHQFSANHTFNGTANTCEGNREAAAAYEPGSGSTIMSYAMLCADENIQNKSDDYFHTHSLTQISEFVTNISTGGSCGVSSNLNNAKPTVEAGADGHIPKSTPFILTGDGADTDVGDTLSYIWEQYDLGAETNSRANFTDDGTRPLFRSFPPSASKSRTFPQISDVLSNTTTYGEILPTTNRDLNFRLTVRDGKGGAASQARKLSVNAAAGPFVVILPNQGATWFSGATETVTWDVANTTADPINCSNVEITLSQDAGETFSTELLASTENDGIETITVPNITTNTARLRVKCVSQPFFAVNAGTLTINTGQAGVNTSPQAVADTFTVAGNSGVVNLPVLANDSDNDGDTLIISGVSNISAGASVTVSNNGNNYEIYYQPATGFSGTETFTYTISDGNSGTASAQVTVTVSEVASPNAAPIANNDNFTVNQNSSVVLLDVLSNDTDDGTSSLTISAVGSLSNGGAAVINGSVIRYTPLSGFNGTESFTYVVSDGELISNAATVTLTVNASVEPPSSSSPSQGSDGGSVGIFVLLFLSVCVKLKINFAAKSYS